MRNPEGVTEFKQLEITESKQLIVEGRAAEVFFKALLRRIDVNGVQVQDFGGKDELRGYLKGLRNISGFLNQVISLGIVRDAEENAESAFQSVRNALEAANLSVPVKPIEPAGCNPIVSVFILPDGKTPGMLETICLRSVENDPAMECVEQYFKCIEQRMSSLPKNMPKAQVQTFLASRPRPGLLLGQAAHRGYWPWDSPVFNNVKQFLQTL